MNKTFELGKLMKVITKMKIGEWEDRYGPILEIYEIEGGQKIIRTNIDNKELLFHENDVTPLSSIDSVMLDGKK